MRGGSVKEFAASKCSKFDHAAPWKWWRFSSFCCALCSLEMKKSRRDIIKREQFTPGWHRSQKHHHVFVFSCPGRKQKFVALPCPRLHRLSDNISFLRLRDSSSIKALKQWTNDLPAFRDTYTVLYTYENLLFSKLAIDSTLASSFPTRKSLQSAFPAQELLHKIICNQDPQWRQNSKEQMMQKQREKKGKIFYFLTRQKRRFRCSQWPRDTKSKSPKQGCTFLCSAYNSLRNVSFTRTIECYTSICYISI